MRHEQGRLVEACELYGLASACLVEAGDKSSDGFFLAARGAAHAALGRAHGDAVELGKAEVAFRESERRLQGSKKRTLLLAAELLAGYRLLVEADQLAPAEGAAQRARVGALLEEATTRRPGALQPAAEESDEVRFAVRILRAAMAV